MAPIAAALPAVELESRLEDGRALLTWMLPETVEKEQLAITSGFIVHRSRTSLGDEGCLVCPPVFEPAARIPLDFSGGVRPHREVFSFVDPLQEGYRYIYKVTAYGRAGAQGPDSEPVEFIY